MKTQRRSEEEVTRWKEGMARLAQTVRGLTAEEKMKMLAAYNVHTCEGHALTDFNTLFLISQTLPAGLVPTVIGGFRQWRGAGRNVKQNERDRMETSLMTPESIEGRAAQYRVAVEKVKLAHAAVVEATEAAKHVCDRLDRCEHGHNYDGISFNLDYVLKSMRCSAWGLLVQQTKVKEFQSSKRIKEVEEQLKKGDVPDFTADNIHAWLESLKATLPEMFAEAVKEVWDYLHPYHPDYYKTNAKNAVFEIGRKIILSYVVEKRYGGGCDINYHRQDNIRALDNVFHLLDGKGTVVYPGDLVTKIKEAGRNKLNNCETAYFRCRWFYGNGNMHLEFKRLDLLDKFNAMAGNETLRGARKVSA